ncbi:MAG: hypothetical protein ACYC4L_17715 [Chloroflexota bacterium]
MACAREPYLSYLLRLWLAEGEQTAWRASLENPTTAERHGFATLEELIDFIRAETAERAAEGDWEREGQLQRRVAPGPATGVRASRRAGGES